ncbi:MULTISPECIES: FecR domain-containing protein [Trichocoleus]|uniref:FecR domain-containing protein n=1 Tax=Trichocoleus desertorum GB2-A4 TaxID=2933944 RepID=A0ABV0JDA1_9CYAN|nr:MULTISPECIES: FecR domain-containing protein [unclassified Trichocoleus]MBD1864406.1 FecR domain-containing protein [Trichocoleus sp. FACHB-46]MBD2096587.1 FecR domain-containing protein [Trichocoleus sp. FACHB-591]
MKRTWVQLLLLFVLGISLLTIADLAIAQSLKVRVNRWLEVRQIQGTVSLYQGQKSQPARNGSRIQAVGEGIQTGAKSSAVLAVDTGIGFIKVAENTNIRVLQLERLATGGQVTKLQVTGGQARLQVRKFTNPASRLEILSPAGLSAVRGTEFGVSVQPDGKTGVATLEGKVAAIAQGASVPIQAGFQSLVIPGEAPLPPTPLREDTRLQLQVLEAVGNNQAQIAGQVDVVNLVLVNDQPLSLDREGQFDVRVALPRERRIRAVVRTPLGKQQIYELAVP